MVLSWYSLIPGSAVVAKVLSLPVRLRAGELSMVATTASNDRDAEKVFVVLVRPSSLPTSSTFPTPPPPPSSRASPSLPFPSPAVQEAPPHHPGCGHCTPLDDHPSGLDG
jgi:hypothetical protein